MNSYDFIVKRARDLAAMSNQGSPPSATQTSTPSAYAHHHRSRSCHPGPTPGSLASPSDEHAMLWEDSATTCAQSLMASKRRASTPDHPGLSSQQEHSMEANFERLEMNWGADLPKHLAFTLRLPRQDPRQWPSSIVAALADLSEMTGPGGKQCDRAQKLLKKNSTAVKRKRSLDSRSDVERKVESIRRTIDQMANELDTVDGADAAESADALTSGQDNTADALPTPDTATPKSDSIATVIETSYRNATDKSGAAHGNRGGGPTIMNETVAELGSAEGANLQFTCRFFPGRKGKSENNVRANRDAIVGLESHFKKPFSDIVEATNMTPRHALCFPFNVIPKLLELVQVRRLSSVRSLHRLLASQQDVRRGKGVFGSRRNISVKDLQDLIDATARQPEPQSALGTDQGTTATIAEHAAAPTTTAASEPEPDSTDSARSPPDSPVQEPDRLTDEPRSPIYEPQSPNYNPHSPSYTPAPPRHTSDPAPHTSSTSLRRARYRSPTPPAATRPSKVPKTAGAAEAAHETNLGRKVHTHRDEDKPRGNDDHHGGREAPRDGPLSDEAASHHSRTPDIARLRAEMEALYRQQIDGLELAKAIAQETWSRDKASSAREKAHGRRQRERAERAERRVDAESERADREQRLAVVGDRHAGYEERRADEQSERADGERRRADEAELLWIEEAERAGEERQRADRAEMRIKQLERELEQRAEMTRADAMEQQASEVHASHAEQAAEEHSTAEGRQSGLLERIAELERKESENRVLLDEHVSYFTHLFDDFKKCRQRHGEM